MATDLHEQVRRTNAEIEHLLLRLRHQDDLRDHPDERDDEPGWAPGTVPGPF